MFAGLVSLYSRSLLPINRSLLTLTHTSGTPGPGAAGGGATPGWARAGGGTPGSWRPGTPGPGGVCMSVCVRLSVCEHVCEYVAMRMYASIVDI